ncbi:hypothetical protein S83_026547 [Arachis hypogaea]
MPRIFGFIRRAFWSMMILLLFMIPIMGVISLCTGGGSKHGDSYVYFELIIGCFGYFFIFLNLRDNSDENNAIDENTMVLIPLFDDYGNRFMMLQLPIEEDTQELTELPPNVWRTLGPLPPVKSYIKEKDKEEEANRSAAQKVNYCSVCIEEFKNGELIQPFGVCVHEFHSTCINSWLQRGKTNCPICRTDLEF